MTSPQVTRTADGSRTLLSRDYGETYHSSHGAVSEARHVFLRGAGVAEQLAASGGVRVLEVGFGTGLNFFVSADLALETGGELRYTALERTLLSAPLLRDLAYAEHLEHPALWEAYLAFRETLPDAVPAGDYAFTAERVRLTLLVGEATEQPLPECDAIYQDAFSPEVNPELWEDGFLARLHTALRPGGSLSTYSVKGAVRRRLVALGFTAQKHPGPPGGKREMLVATKPA